MFFFFFQAEDGIRDLVRSRGLGDVYKRQPPGRVAGVIGEGVDVGIDALRIRPAATGGVEVDLSLIHI